MNRELRTCRGCRKQDYTTHDWGQLKLFKYGVRHYAHAECLVGLIGTHGIVDLPDHQLRQFPAALADKLGIIDNIQRVIDGKKPQHDAWVTSARRASASSGSRARRVTAKAKEVKL
jgi:hypothetical protein